MTKNQNKMTAWYKAILVFSILMFVFVMLAGAAMKSTSSGFGMFIWGYTAWLMYKRRISDLVLMYKVMLWFDIIAFAVSIAIFAFTGDEVKRHFGYSVTEALVSFSVLVCLTFGLYKYFINNLIYTASEGGAIDAEGSIWEQVTKEINQGQKIQSLWIRAFTEADGDKSKSQARYIKLRVQQLRSTHSKTNDDSRASADIISKTSNKLVLGLFCAAVIGGLCVLVLNMTIWSEIKNFSLYSCTLCEDGKCTTDDDIKSFVVNSGNGVVKLRFSDNDSDIQSTPIVKSGCRVNRKNYEFSCHGRGEVLLYDGTDLIHRVDVNNKLLRCGVKNN
jgi:hypothetical protein